MKKFFFLSAIYLCLLPVGAAVIVPVYWLHKTGNSGETLFVKENSHFRLLNPGSIFESKPVQYYSKLEELPEDLVQALIWQEDQSFYHHRGYSLREMVKAILDYLLTGRKLRGASTISQQLARTLFLNREKSFRRKMLELRIARVLEEQLGKNGILELYFNHVYWGKNHYGIGEAARFYFKKSPKNLNRIESVFLISILPNPDSCQGPKNCKNKGVNFRMRRLKRLLEKAGSEKE